MAHSPHPLVVDRFADHDCRKTAKICLELDHWGGLLDSEWHVLPQLKAAGAQPSSPVLLGGGTENWPELVELLHQHFTVLGPTARQLQQLRSPEYWQTCARAAGVAFPETHWKGASAVDDGSIEAGVMRESAEGPAGHIKDWLIKPRRGAGGHGIGRVNGYHASLQSVEDSHYWQRRISGRSLGVYCNLTSDGQAELLGATEALSAEQWPGPSEFIYRGSLGPISLSDSQRLQINQLCRVIQTTSRCRGWLQFDFIEDAAGVLWLLELNPRWAAGMEILFLAGINPVAHHCRAWQTSSDPASFESSMATLSPGDTHFAKAVVYADRELTLTRERIERLHSLPPASFADLPSHVGSRSEPATRVVSHGEPLLTVRASGPSSSLLEQLTQLRETALMLCRS
ncbi:MAG: ATP-grasp domain-containing protein [Pirellulaceae bacterium]|nr:ATP-grasp domain-containing protein [Pirellulaceae bacterium]